MKLLKITHYISDKKIGDIYINPSNILYFFEHDKKTKLILINGNQIKSDLTVEEINELIISL